MRSLRPRPLVSAGIAIVAAAASAPVALGHGGGEEIATDPASILTSWTLDPTAIVPLVVAAVAWAWAVRRVDTAHPDHRWPVGRSVLYALGLAAVALALVSPIDTYSDELLIVHMVQHLLLTSVAPPLFAASGIVTLVLRLSPRSTRDRYLLPFLRSRVVSAVTHPIVGWFAFAAVMWGTHFSAVYNIALVDERVHILEHLAYFLAACLFWWPVFSPDPMRWHLRPLAAIVYLFTQMPQQSFLAVALMNAPGILYPAYEGKAAAFGFGTLADQQAAGALMWVMGDGVMIVALAIVVRQWLRLEARETARIDARLDRERREREASG